jgi:hypothetical protein
VACAVRVCALNRACTPSLAMGTPDLPASRNGTVRGLLRCALAASCFIAQQRNAVLVGGTGTGKTHLAIAIARSCIRSGAHGRFYNVVDLGARIFARSDSRIDQCRTSEYACRAYKSQDFQPGFFISRDRSGGKRGGDDLMAQPLRTRRRALTVLATAMNGRTEAFMTVRGFSPDLIAGLISAGLASTHVEHIVKGQRTMEVVRVRITEAGRQALAKTLQER